MQKRKVFGIITLLLTLSWMVFIFCMSAADATESGEMSHNVGYTVGSVLHSDFKDWSEIERTDYAARIDHTVRKTAHFTEYAILGALLALTCSFFGVLFSLRVPLACAVGIVYAATDEFHQRFVPGRAGQFADVMLDSAGVCFGCSAAILLWLLVCRIYEKRKGKTV